VLSFPSGPLFNNEMICVTEEMCEIMFCTTKQYLHLHFLFKYEGIDFHRDEIDFLKTFMSAFSDFLLATSDMFNKPHYNITRPWIL